MSANKKELNIGCGPTLKRGCINLDKYAFPGVDIVHDIEKKWPFDDNEFDSIYASHILEHCHDLISVINEAYRCLKKGGRFYIEVPWWAGEWAHGDPTHVRFFDHNSFSVYSDWYDRYRCLGIAGPWKKISQDYDYTSSRSDLTFLTKMGFSTCLCMRVVLERV